MKRIGVLGGTFNPIHNGHLRLAFLMKERLGLLKVLLIPSLMPPHKKAPTDVDTADRVEMLRRVISEHPFLELDEFEIGRKEKSYTYYTLKHLREKDPEAEYYFLTGSDMFLSLDRWFRSEDIMEMATFCGVARNEEDFKILESKQAEYKARGFETVALMAEPYEISSTEIREMIARREDASEYLTRTVFEYIKENGLYGSL